MILNWLITRKCNRRCSYCGIVHDPKHKDFKKISDINKNEKPLSEVYDGIMQMMEIYPSEKLFHIFYGGEPFLKPGFTEFIKDINKVDGLMYTVITNGSLKDEVIETFKVAGKYKGLTVSLDPMIMNEANKSFNDVKNNNALDLLRLNQELVLTDDMVVECVFDKQNLEYTIPFLDMMSKEYPEVTISISVYDYPKNDYYDFALNDTATPEYIKSMRLRPLNDKVLGTFIAIRKGVDSGKYKIHLGDDEEFVDKVNSTVDSTYMCELAYSNSINDLLKPVEFKTLTIDADGEFRLCLRIAGTNKLTLMDIFGPHSKAELINNTHKLYDSLKVSYDKMCKGCAWTCPMMDEHWNDLSDVAHTQGG